MKLTIKSRLLDVLAKHPEGLSAKSLFHLTGYAAAEGTMAVMLSKLKEENRVVGRKSSCTCCRRPQILYFHPGHQK